ncbi:MAG: FAD-dependent oxidoreductase [Planctomycetota bacterium]|nr:FAD-dependent oxidoreductase [Planctomycetota bacterium]
MSAAPYLIVGNSAAAVGCIEGIRSVDRERPVILLSREPYRVYSRPLVSYLLAGKITDERMFYRPPDFYERNGVEAILGVTAVSIVPSRKVVETADGRAFGFEKLLIATGGRPVIPGDVPGIDAPGVFTLTSWDDARAIKAHIAGNGAREALVVGGGLIGLKAVEALVAVGMKVTMVELSDRILSATFDRAASDLARETLERAGVAVRCGTTVARMEKRGGMLAGAELRDGSSVPCSLAIIAIGVLPDLSLVEGSGIRTDRGILVDDTLRTSAPDIYAAGDVAQAPAAEAIGGGRKCIPILPNAYRQGFVAGQNMAGRKRTYRGAMPMNAVDVLGLPTISVGLTDPPEGSEYEILSALDREAPWYKKLVLKGGRIVGAVFAGRIDRAGIITGLIRDRADISGFRDLLLSGDFGLISLPAEYRKHIVSGAGIEV